MRATYCITYDYSRRVTLWHMEFCYTYVGRYVVSLPGVWLVKKKHLLGLGQDK